MAEHLAREIVKVDKYINDQTMLDIPASTVKDMRDAQAASLGDKVMNVPQLDHEGASLLLAALGAGGWSSTQVTSLSVKVNARLERGQAQPRGGKRDNQHIDTFDAYIPLWLADFWKSDVTDHAKMQAGANFLYDLGAALLTEHARKIVVTSFCQIAYAGVHLTYQQKYNLYLSLKNLTAKKWRPAGSKHAVRYPHGHVVHYPSDPIELSPEHYAHAYKDAPLYGVKLDLSSPVVDGVPARETHAGLRAEILADHGGTVCAKPPSQRSLVGQCALQSQQPQQLMQQMCQVLVQTLTQSLGIGGASGAAPAAGGLSLNFNPDQPSRPSIADASSVDAIQAPSGPPPLADQLPMRRGPSIGFETPPPRRDTPNLFDFKPRVAEPPPLVTAVAAGGSEAAAEISASNRTLDDVALAAYDSRERAKAEAKKAEKQAELDARNGATLCKPVTRVNGKQPARGHGPLASSVANNGGVRSVASGGVGKRGRPRKVAVKLETPPKKRARNAVAHPPRPRATRGTAIDPSPVVRYNGGLIYTVWKGLYYRAILCSNGYGGDRKVAWGDDYKVAFATACDMIDAKRDSEP